MISALFFDFTNPSDACKYPSARVYVGVRLEVKFGLTCKSYSLLVMVSHWGESYDVRMV